MKKLRSFITNYTTEFKSDISEFILNGFSENQKKAIDIIIHHSHLSDDALNRKLAEEIYGYAPNHRTYKSFKESLTQKINTIILMHKSKGSTIQKITFELIEEVAVIRKMYVLGLKEVVKPNINKSLKKAITHHKYEMARSISLLKVSYYEMNGTKAQRDSAKTEFKAINTMCEKEAIIKEVYADLCRVKSIDSSIRSTYMDMIKKIEPMLEFDNCNYHYFYYSILLLLAKSNDYVMVCKKAIEYFENLHFDHEAYISIFKNRLLKYKISIGEYASCKLIINALIEDNREYSYHWYLKQLTHVQVLLYLGEYDKALSIFNKVKDSRNFREQKKDHRNEWHVLGMYVNLMSDNEDKISIHQIKYNLNYGQEERSKTNKKFLIGEIFYHLKTGNHDVDKKIDHLRRICNGDGRTLSLCNYLTDTNTKFGPVDPVKFENEIVQYESLITKL